MAPRLEPESRRLLTAFSANLNRLDPQPLDWQRFYDFILYAFGHEPPSGTRLSRSLFYKHAVDLLLRQATLARKDTDSKDAIADRIPV